MEGKNKMEDKKKRQGKKDGDRGTTSSPNIADELFGPKEPPTPPASSSPFDALFAHPSQGQGSNSTGASRSWSQQSQNQENYWRGENGEQNTASQLPHYYTSSIYYGAQDICPTPTQSTQHYPRPQKTGEEDDPNRKATDGGEWWEGSVYY